MTIEDFLYLLRKNLWIILSVGLLTGALVYFLTKNQKLQYTSEATVSTGLVSAFSIKNTDTGNKVDREYTQNEIENLIALAAGHETMEELSMRLLAKYFSLEIPPRRLITTAVFTEIQELVSPEMRQDLAGKSEEEAYHLILKNCDADRENGWQEIVYSDEPYFGVDYLKNELIVSRKNNSDLLQFRYTTTDPGICQQTIAVLIDIFMTKHADIKKGHSSSVVDYFREETEKTATRLQAAENQLLQFRTQNKIINYYEQTRSIAYRKEDLDELNFKENMSLESTEATLTRLEKELNNRGRLSDLNAGLLDKRKQLSRLSEELARYDILALDAQAPDQEQKRVLLDSLETIKEEITDYAQNVYDFEQTPDGIATQNLLTEWLRTVVNQEQSEARVRVIRDRQVEFNEVYSKFAPWGSILTKIEREIDLAEDAYLENLHSYNQAVLHQQHTLMSTNLKVLDAPFYPNEPKDWKRLMLIALGLIAGSLFVLTLLIGLEFFDQSLKTPTRAFDATGMEVAGILPEQVRRPRRLAQTMKAHTHHALSLLMQQVKVETLNKAQGTKKILIASVREGEGKTTLAAQLSDALRLDRSEVLFLRPENNDGSADEAPVFVENLTYKVDPALLKVNDLNELPLQSEGLPALANYDYLLMEMPALLTGAYPIRLLQQFDLVLLTVRSDRTWDAADEQLLKTLRKATDSPIKLVLNGLDQHQTHVYLGETPKTRKKSRSLLSKELFIKTEAE